MPEQHSSTITNEFKQKWAMGARSAYLIALLAQKYTSEITIFHEGEKGSAKSITDILMLVTRPGSRIEVTAQGPDAEAAMEGIAELFSCGGRMKKCDQKECPDIPMLLGYTKKTINYGCSSRHSWSVERVDRD